MYNNTMTARHEGRCKMLQMDKEVEVEYGAL